MSKYILSLAFVFVCSSSFAVLEEISCDSESLQEEYSEVLERDDFQYRIDEMSDEIEWPWECVSDEELMGVHPGHSPEDSKQYYESIERKFLRRLYKDFRSRRNQIP